MKYILLILSLILFSCKENSTKDIVKAVIHDVETKTDSFEMELEIAKTYEERAKGLMYRRELADNHGMLFIFDKPELHQFWMKNTPLSLDIVWFDKNMNVIEIVNSATPFSEEPVGGHKESMFVLEVKAGVGKKLNLSIGDTLVLSKD